MERRSFVRALLAGLALAPVARCLIDIPDAKPAPLPTAERMRSIVDAINGPRHRASPQYLALKDLLDKAPAYECLDRFADVYPVLVMNKTHIGAVQLGGDGSRGRYLTSHDLRLRAPSIPSRPLVESGQDWGYRDYYPDRSSFAEWDRRVGKALLS